MRYIPPEHEIGVVFSDPMMRRRRQVLRETIDRFSTVEPGHYLKIAQANLARWQAESSPLPTGFTIEVLPGDWGVVAQSVTRRWGTSFAVLNMANAHVPGGGYIKGMVAQEENLFRRTDAHFSIRTEHLVPDGSERYQPIQTALLEGQGGRVYLDVQNPRVCIRGPEDRTRSDLGYPWLAQEDIFSFFELRAAAVDRRRGQPYDDDEMRRRIDVQLDTLQEAGLRHVVLSAFGCGAFLNPAVEVARLYRTAIEARKASFDHIVFAIFNAGYGPDNFTPFRDAFADFSGS